MDLSDISYSRDLMDKAAAAYSEALKVYTRVKDPSNWAWTKYNLGAVYYEIGARESGTEHLQMATESLREAMSVLSKDKTPGQYRQTRANLEQTLDALRKRGGFG